MYSAAASAAWQLSSADDLDLPVLVERDEEG
jgi:hypothetical protein